MRSFSRLLLAALVATSSGLAVQTAPSLPPADTRPLTASVTLDASAIVGRMNPRLIGGTNLALWNEPRHFSNPTLRQWTNELGAGIIRLPGGSWSNAYYWNGHGVRDERGHVDPSRVGPDGYPAVDYSGYEPGFMVDSKTLRPGTGFHGNVDVKTLHDYVKATPGAVALPSLNAGTGRAIDAGEWAKWALREGYATPYWHVGNELGGSWEPGTTAPDGTKITGPEFVRRYNAIADAVHAVDPAAKLGAYAFAEDILKSSGERVNFISIHTYPGSTTLTPQQNLARVPETVAREVRDIRALIEKYQPDRKDCIEIGYTEWNLSGGLNASDLFSGLWKLRMLGEFALNGVTFATQWDTFTHSAGMREGHGLFFTERTTFTRKAGYFALWLWNNYNGDRILRPKVEGEATVYSYASRDDDAVYLLLINPDDDRPADIAVRLSGFSPAARGEQVALSAREYHWNTYTYRPEWSQSPVIRPLDTGASFNVTVAPFSATVIRVPARGRDFSRFARAQGPLPQPSGRPTLRFLLPPEVYVGDRLVGQLQAATSPEDNTPFPGYLPPARLAGDATVTLDRSEVRLAEGSGHFSFVVRDTRPVTLYASVAGVRQSVVIHPKSSEPRPQLVWDFQKQSPADTKAFSSDYALSADILQRANKEVARIDISPDTLRPEAGKPPVVFRINSLPPQDQLERTNIRGVFLDLRTPGLQSEDPNASLSVIMQSSANFWMVLGRVPLQGATEWTRRELTITQENHLQAVGSAYNLWFILSANRPVQGSVFIDRIGFLVR